MPQIVVGAFLVRGERLMLGLRSVHRRSFPGVWDSIGGHVEDGETLDEALVRELGEEIGIAPTAFTSLGLFSLPDVEDCQLYRVDSWHGGEPMIRDDEHEAIAWFTVDEACALTNLAFDFYRELFRALDLAADPKGPAARLR